MTHILQCDADEELAKEVQKFNNDKESFIKSLNAEQRIVYGVYLIQQAKVISIKEAIKNKFFY